MKVYAPAYQLCDKDDYQIIDDEVFDNEDDAIKAACLSMLKWEGFYLADQSYLDFHQKSQSDFEADLAKFNAAKKGHDWKTIQQLYKLWMWFPEIKEFELKAVRTIE